MLSSEAGAMAHGISRYAVERGNAMLSFFAFRIWEKEELCLRNRKVRKSTGDKERRESNVCAKKMRQFFTVRKWDIRDICREFSFGKNRALLLGALREFLGSGIGSSPPGIKQR